MSSRALILAILLLVLVLYMSKVAADNSDDSVIQADGAGGDPLGVGAAVQTVADAVKPSASAPSGGGDMSKATLTQYAQAIYDFEDPNKNSIATRNNNPGNLKFAGQAGAVKDPNSDFAQFPTFADGFNALVKQLQRNVSRNPDFTLLQDRNQYLGGTDPNNVKTTGEGNPFSYAQFVAGRLGVTVNTTLGQLFGGKNG